MKKIKEKIKRWRAFTRTTLDSGDGTSYVSNNRIDSIDKALEGEPINARELEEGL